MIANIIGAAFVLALIVTPQVLSARETRWLRSQGIECIYCQDSGFIDLCTWGILQGCQECGRGRTRKAERVSPWTEPVAVTRPHLVGTLAQPVRHGHPAAA